MEQRENMHESDHVRISRRRLVRALVASGLAAAGSMLPNRWSSPVVEVGVLPAHAQVSPVPTPTPTIHAITTCTAFDALGGAFIYPTSTITSFCLITPADPSIQIRQTITLNEPNHPQNGVVRVVEGPTDATGQYTPPDFDLNSISPLLSPGVDRLEFRWEFVNAADGVNVCVNLLEVASPPS